MIIAKAARNGMTLLIDEQLWEVIDVKLVTHGSSSLVFMKLQNLATAAIQEKRFAATEKMERVLGADRRLQYRYAEGSDFVFSDPETGEQVTIAGDQLQDKSRWLSEGLEVLGITFSYNDIQALRISFPDVVVLQVVAIEENGAQNQATLSTGAIVAVPLSIKAADWIRIDTRDGTYVEQVVPS